MKKNLVNILKLGLFTITLGSFVSCGDSSTGIDNNNTNNNAGDNEKADIDDKKEDEENNNSDENKSDNNEQKPNQDNQVLVAYFSATGTTERVAEKLVVATKGDLFEITPTNPYTSDDLNYSNSNSRTSIEQNDSTSRPEIANKVENMESYSTVFIGYPIWWYKAPRIIYTFLESYNFSSKNIIPFCTSGGSGINSGLNEIKALAPSANWLEGKRFSGSVSQEEINSFVEGLNL